MINQDCIEYKRWMKMLKAPTSKKTTERLENPRNRNARCCLGHACAANNSKRDKIRNIVFYGEDRESSLSPEILAKTLNITHDGLFTKAEAKEVRKNCVLSKWVDDSDLSLVFINDKKKLSPAQIGELIQDLAKIERETEKSMFARYTKESI